MSSAIYRIALKDGGQASWPDNRKSLLNKSVEGCCVASTSNGGVVMVYGNRTNGYNADILAVTATSFESLNTLGESAWSEPKTVISNLLLPRCSVALIDRVLYLVVSWVDLNSNRYKAHLYTDSTGRGTAFTFKGVISNELSQSGINSSGWTNAPNVSLNMQPTAMAKLPNGTLVTCLPYYISYWSYPGLKFKPAYSTDNGTTWSLGPDYGFGKNVGTAGTSLTVCVQPDSSYLIFLSDGTVGTCYLYEMKNNGASISLFALNGWPNAAFGGGITRTERGYYVLRRGCVYYNPSSHLTAAEVRTFSNWSLIKNYGAVSHFLNSGFIDTGTGLFTWFTTSYTVTNTQFYFLYSTSGREKKRVRNIRIKNIYSNNLSRKQGYMDQNNTWHRICT